MNPNEKQKDKAQNKFHVLYITAKPNLCQSILYTPNSLANSRNFTLLPSSISRPSRSITLATHFIIILKDRILVWRQVGQRSSSINISIFHPSSSISISFSQRFVPSKRNIRVAKTREENEEKVKLGHRSLAIKRLFVAIVTCFELVSNRKRVSCFLLLLLCK